MNPSEQQKDEKDKFLPQSQEELQPNLINQTTNDPAFNQSHSNDQKDQKSQQNANIESKQQKGQRISTVFTSKQQILDPIQEILKNNDFMPLLAILQHVQLDRLIQQKPLLCLLASKFIPLQIIFKNRKVEKFPKDQDQRTPLHYAIQNNDIKAAAWCIQNGNPNQRDNFGNTPILDAIRLGRRQCFLLCLKGKLYDERSPVVAATYNKHWQLKILYGMKMDIFNVRDDQNRTAFERAIQYNSFDCAQFLVKINNKVNIKGQEKNAQSQGLIRMLKRIKKQQSFTSKALQFIKPLILLSIIFIGTNASQYKLQSNFAYQETTTIYSVLSVFILCLYGLMWILGQICNGGVYCWGQDPLSMILRAPSYKISEQICPVCIHLTDIRYDHCYKCGCCVDRFHKHSFVCINKSNEVFWVMVQFIWLYMVWNLLGQFNSFLLESNLSLLKFHSYSPLLLVAKIQLLWAGMFYFRLCWFLFLCFLTAHQTFYCLSLLGMMFMRRKYQEVIHSEKYRHLYFVDMLGKKFINVEKRVFQRGPIRAPIRCIRNLLVYFFVDN